MTRYRRGGGNELRPGRPPGRPRGVSSRRLAELLLSLPRREVPFRPRAVRPNVQEIARFIEQATGVRISARQVNRLLQPFSPGPGDRFPTTRQGVNTPFMGGSGRMTTPVDGKEVGELFAAVRAGDSARVAVLLARDARLANVIDHDGMSPLITAAYHRVPAVVKALMAAGAEPDIFAASALGLQERLALLLTSKPERVREVSPDGWTALHLAAHFGQLDSIRLLLARGADVAAVSKNAIRNEPLQAAVASGEVEAARLLLDAGAAVDARSHGQFTALHIAAENGDLPLVKLLRAAGADPALRLETGATPEDLARAKGHPEVARFLRPP